LASLFLALGAGCSSSSGTGKQGLLGVDGGGGGGPDAGTTTSDVPGAGFSLHVDTASFATSISGVTASTGKRFVIVNLTLQNSGAKTPLSTNPVLFSLQTAQSLVISVAAAEPAKFCDPAISVAAGGSVSCSVAFEMPSDQTAAKLLYDDLHGDVASAGIPTIDTPPATDACQQAAAWLDSTSSTCSACVDAAASGACAGAEDKYANACTTCGNSCDQAADYCGCEKSCDSAQCQTLFQESMACYVTACASKCP